LVPQRPLLLDISLWSANLVSIGADVESALPFADSFHLDVADGHFAPTLLFFPDLIAAIRRLTTKPLHIHLMVSDPAALVDLFLEAGADIISVHVETETVSGAVKKIAEAGRKAGIALLLESPVDLLLPHLPHIEAIVALGTHIGIKGVDLAPNACDRLRAIRQLIEPYPHVLLYADGGIRKHTVPQLRHAGADAIVPGSLIFNSPDRARTYEWLKSL
jgi:ribulose-phosphate 3-epimerase